MDELFSSCLKERCMNCFYLSEIHENFKGRPKLLFLTRGNALLKKTANKTGKMPNRYCYESFTCKNFQIKREYSEVDAFVPWEIVLRETSVFAGFVLVS